MVEAIRNDLRTRFADYVAKGEMQIFIAHTNFYQEAETFRKELTAIFPNVPVTLSVSCHIGPGSLAVAVARCY